MSKFKLALTTLFAYVESRLGVRSKVTIGLVAVSALAYSTYDLTKPTDIIQTTVKITNRSQTSGGSGVVIASSANFSTALTNAHVCKVAQNGGVVVGPRGRFLITSYKVSKLHDLCIVNVNGDLGETASLALFPPTPFYSNATIAGHPALVPATLTKGHFSGNDIIQVLVEFRRCTDEDMQDPGSAFICMIVGGFPVVKAYESTLVTALIQPGSSGSAVYNSSNELSGLVFAGAGDIGFAWTVPYSYIYRFLNDEVGKLDLQTPNLNVDIRGDRDQHTQDRFKKFKAVCANPLFIKNGIKDICTSVKSDLIWRQ